jgi:hypothetical protein
MAESSWLQHVCSTGLLQISVSFEFSLGPDGLEKEAGQKQVSLQQKSTASTTHRSSSSLSLHPHYYWLPEQQRAARSQNMDVRPEWPVLKADEKHCPYATWRRDERMTVQNFRKQLICCKCLPSRNQEAN